MGTMAFVSVEQSINMRGTISFWDTEHFVLRERGGSVVEYRTPEREVGGSKPTAAVLCP